MCVCVCVCVCVIFRFDLIGFSNLHINIYFFKNKRLTNSDGRCTALTDAATFSTGTVI